MRPNNTKLVIIDHRIKFPEGGDAGTIRSCTYAGLRGRVVFVPDAGVELLANELRQVARELDRREAKR